MSKYLRITKDSIDVSGKTFRESEEKLSELLPDLTRELLSSSIILSQGMPNKFSAFKPSGRKELLEKLTKSDFMIEDIKSRLAARSTELTNNIRTIEDTTLIKKTNLATYTSSLELDKARKATAVKPDFDTEIKTLTVHMEAVNKDVEAAKIAIKTKELEVEGCNNNLLAKLGEKANLTKQLYENYTAKINPIRTKKTEIETQLLAAEKKVKTFRENPDVCPTCGQKLPNAEHITAEKLKAETEVKILTEQLNTVKAEIVAVEKTNTDYTAQIKANFETDLNDLTDKLTKAKTELNHEKDNLNDYSHAYDLDKENLTKITIAKDNWDKEQATLDKAIVDLETVVNKLSVELTDLDKTKTELNEHYQRVKWLDTLTKRDFRGYILTDIIKYLDGKAKSYAATVFGHTDLNIYLDGNDLNITYNGKMFDNLSGGEKTRVDLIIQFSIRDLLTTYMNAGANILVLDEVTDFLDAQSCEAVMSMIEKDLKTVESVFIISHHSDELDLPIDSELHVYKGEDGISTVYQK